MYDEYLQREGYDQSLRPSGTHPTHITDFHPTHISDQTSDRMESLLNPHADEFAPLQPQRLNVSSGRNQEGHTSVDTTKMEIPPKLPTNLKEYIREYVKPHKQSPESVLPNVTPRAFPFNMGHLFSDQLGPLDPLKMCFL